MRDVSPRSGWIMVWAGLVISLLAGVLASPSVSANTAQDRPQHEFSVAPSATNTPTPTAPGNILFRDDFATYSNRWRVEASPKASVAYGAAALNMRVISPGVSIWSVPDFDVALADYSVQVAVDFRDGGSDSLFGFVLQYEDDEHFYALVVTPEGEWQFMRREESAWIDLTPPDIEPVERDPETPITRLRAEIMGVSFAFFVDDQLAGEVTADDVVSGGRFGLIALAGKGYIDVSFDDVLVIGIAEAS